MNDADNAPNMLRGKILLMLLVTSSIVFIVQYGLTLLTLLVKLGLNIFISVGFTLKSYIWLLVVWMFIFCTSRNPPFAKIVYKAMANITIPSGKECSICLNDNCDALLN